MGSVKAHVISDCTTQCGILEEQPTHVCPTSTEAGKKKQRKGRQRRDSVVCQAPGCDVELINCKTYYKRYRICVSHCNLPCLPVDGRPQRFCQQCGRFHDLLQFDGSKKSCRYKLKRHNERRKGMDPGRRHSRSCTSEDGDQNANSHDAELHTMLKLSATATRSRPPRSNSLPAHRALVDDTGTERKRSDVNTIPSSFALTPHPPAASRSGSRSRHSVHCIPSSNRVSPKSSLSLTERVLAAAGGVPTSASKEGRSLSPLRVTDMHWDNNASSDNFWAMPSEAGSAAHDTTDALMDVDLLDVLYNVLPPCSDSLQGHGCTVWDVPPPSPLLLNVEQAFVAGKLFP